jgi:hypothetical protein
MALYDYGKHGNMQVYGQKEAPLLPLNEKYNIPTGLFSGDMDGLADPKDVEILT